MSKLALKDKILQGEHNSDEDMSCLASVPAVLDQMVLLHHSASTLALTRRLGKSSEKFHASRSTSSCLTLHTTIFQTLPFRSFLQICPPSWFLPGPSWWYYLSGPPRGLPGRSLWSLAGRSFWPSLWSLPGRSLWSLAGRSFWPSLWFLPGRSSWSLAGRSSWSLVGRSPWSLAGRSSWTFPGRSLWFPSSLVFLPPTYLFPSLISLCCSPLLSSNATYVYPLNYNLIIFENT
jgi:hypothetical protein